MTTTMTRRSFLKSTCAAGAMVSTAGCTTMSRASNSATPPNILFICTDDQAAWALGRSGNPDAYTPNMDRLLAEGAHLPNSFVTTPVCSPSRATTLTSRYGTEVGITDWLNHRLDSEATQGLDPKFTTWPALLGEAGYATGLVGKWHLGTIPEYHPAREGFQYYAGFLTGGTTGRDPELEVDGITQPHQGLTVDVLTDYAIDYLKRDHGNRPFALNLHYRSPHAPYLPVADEDMAHFEGSKLAIPNPDFPDLDTERVERLMREYLANVAGIDRNLGRILRILDETGLADSTIVIYTSDNGYNIGHHGLLHKGNASWVTRWAAKLPQDDQRILRPNMFDTSLRVPTGIRWPGVIRPGTVVDAVTSNLDWFPTVLAMAGVQVPSGLTIHGRSFEPLLRGTGRKWDHDLYGEYSQHHYTKAHLRMYRTREWKFVRDFLRKDRDELYHLASDPGESANLIADPGARGARQSLNGKLLARMRELKDPVLT